MMIALALVVAAPIEVVGFSPDDRYAAWIEHGVGAGSGFPFATLHVTDIAKSAEALPPRTVTLDGGRETDTEEAAVERARALADDAREKLEIKEWAHARNIQHDNGEMSDHEGAPIGTMEVKARKAAGRCQEPFAPLLLKITVHFLDDDKPARLVEDKRVPKDRPCLTGCALDRIYAHGKAALVFVKCGAPGFEGPASKLVALTGTLPYGLDEELPAESQ